jgi:hypothetical protein
VTKGADGATKETLVRVYGISRDIIAGLERLGDGFATARRGRSSAPWWDSKWPRSPSAKDIANCSKFWQLRPHGSDVNALLGRGFELETMADLVHSELAAVPIEIVENHDSKVEIALVQITDAGWRVLEGLTPRLPNGQ